MKGEMSLLKILFLLVFFLLSACDNRKELVTNLNSKSAIETMMYLTRAGVESEREIVTSGRENKYRILVSNLDLSRAIVVLGEFNLPKESEQADICLQSQGFSPSAPEMTQMRLDRALELRIESLLSALPGVVSVSAMIKSHLASIKIAGAENREDLTRAELPTASVVLRYSGSSEVLSIDKIKTIVGQAVPRLLPDQIFVEFLPSSLQLDTPLNNATASSLVRLPAFGFRVPREDRSLAALSIFVVVSLICFAGFIIGAAWNARNFRKKIIQKARSGTAEHARSLILEAQLAAQDSFPTDKQR
jgi:type III secretory pathway lipoprotein EscJ